MAEYAKLAGKAMAGATILAFDQNAEQIEGEWHGSQTVLLEFESLQRAQEFYHSEDYQAVIGYRFDSARSHLYIFEGLEAQQPG